jgi:hypothetical protein
LVFVALIARAALSAGLAWTPDTGTITKLESIIRIPSNSWRAPTPVANYARYYAGVTIKGRPVIRGEFVIPLPPDKPAGIYIGAESDFPGIMDGGCGVVNLLYDVKAARIVWIRCNGYA